jgi:hypothetical protein
MHNQLLGYAIQDLIVEVARKLVVNIEFEVSYVLFLGLFNLFGVSRLPE